MTEMEAAWAWIGHRLEDLVMSADLTEEEEAEFVQQIRRLALAVLEKRRLDTEGAVAEEVDRVFKVKGNSAEPPMI